jgi:hypothetical protein
MKNNPFKNYEPPKLLFKDVTLLNIARSSPITWKDIKHIEFQDNDIFEICYVEAWENGPDNSGGDQYEAKITRQRYETPEEYQKRLDKMKDRQRRDKEMRYERYLELKEEFEPKTKKDENS